MRSPGGRSFLRGLVPADRVRWASVPGEQLRPEPRLSPVANRPEPARRSRHVFGRDRKPGYEFFPVDRTHSACRSQDVLDSSAFAYQFSIIFASANVGQSKWASDPEMRFCRRIRGNLGRYEDPLRQNLPEKLSRLWTGHSGSQVEFVGQRPQFSVSSSQFSPASSSRHAGEFGNEFAVSWSDGNSGWSGRDADIERSPGSIPRCCNSFPILRNSLFKYCLNKCGDAILLDIVISG